MSGYTLCQSEITIPAIELYNSQTIKYLNRYQGMESYDVKSEKLHKFDLNSDGDIDLVYEVIYCEKSSCHPTTQVSRIAVFLAKNRKYIFATERKYTLFGKIANINKNQIKVNIFDIYDGDPQCCPELKRKESLTFRNNKLFAQPRS